MGKDWVGEKTIPKKRAPRKREPAKSDPLKVSLTRAEFEKAQLRASSLADAPPPPLSRWTPTEQYGHRLCPDCGYADGRHSKLCRGTVLSE